MTAAEYKALREKVGTQAEVSARLQVSRVTVAKRETGAMVITEEAALALSALAGRGGAGGRKRVAPKRRKAPNKTRYMAISAQRRGVPAHRAENALLF